MKKICLILLMIGLLSGCGQVETLETLGEITHVSPTTPQVRQVVLATPDHALLETAVSDAGMRMYACDGYTMVLQTFSAGDLEATVRTLSGYAPENLTILETVCGDHARYDWVWTAAAAEGDMICRGAILDDGNYHYALCAIGLSENARMLQAGWNDLFDSFCLKT